MQLEQSILGTIINNPACQMLGLQKIQKVELFSDIDCRLVWSNVEAMYIKSLEIDSLTLTDFMRKNGDYKKLPKDVIDSIYTYNLSVSNFTTKLELLRNNYFYNTLKNTTNNIVEKCTDKSQNPLDIVNASIASLESLLTIETSQSIIPIGKSFAEIGDYIFKEKSKSAELDNDNILDIGFEELNRIVKISGGKFIIIAARPSMGKSAFMSDMIRRIGLINKESVGLITIEMTAKEVSIRVASAHLDWNTYKFNDGNFYKENDKVKFNNFANQYVSAPIYIDDDPYVTINTIQTRILYMYRKYGIKVVFIDHLGLIDLLLGKYKNKENALGELSASLKRLARKLNIPIIALHQLSRSVESRMPPRPLLSDLRDSGSLEQDADIVFLLYRPDYYPHIAFEPKTKEEKDKYGHLKGRFISFKRDGGYIDFEGKLELIIAKNRGGTIGRLYYNFIKEYQRLEYDKVLTEEIKNNK